MIGRSAGVSLVILLLLLASATAVDATTCTDSDGDGFFAEDGCGSPRDCSDLDAAIRPGAAEACNGIDDDCDGGIDNTAACDPTCALPDKVSGDRNLTPSRFSNAEQQKLIWTGTEYALVMEDWDHSLHAKHVFFMRLNEDGSSKGAPVRVSSEAANDGVGRPSVAWNGSEYGVAWSDGRHDRRTEIYFARVGADGVKIGDDVRITNALWAKGRPTLLWNGFEYGLFWRDDRLAGPGSSGVYFTRLGADGQPLIPAVRLFDGQVFSALWNGEQYLVLRGTFPGTVFNLVDVDGTLIGPDRLVVQPAWALAAQWTGNGYALAWSDRRHGNRDIYFALFDEVGNRTSAEIQVTGDPGDEDTPSLSFTGEQFGVSYWTEDGIRFQQLDAGGGTVGPGAFLVRMQLQGASVLAWSGSSYVMTWPDIFNMYSARIGCDCPDLDGDGWSTCQDCDEQDTTVFPTAEQICDGVNNDCDHPGWPLLFDTNDGDDDSDGFTECGGDCADWDGAIYPGAPQICDRRNNDCNDPFWPEGPRDDADWDNDETPICAGDCNDRVWSIAPWQVEYCGDGVDQNCDGLDWVPGCEICNNGIDDNGNGLIDCFDYECQGGAPCTILPQAGG
jgi:hypothetical protein